MHKGPTKLYRWILYVVLALLALMVLVLGGVTLWLQTGNAQSYIRKMIEEEAAAGLGYKISLGEFHASGFLGAEISDLQLEDAKGVWLEAEGLEIALFPTLTPASHIHLRTLHAEEIRFLRVPELPLSTPEETSSGASPTVTLSSIGVERLTLMPAVTGMDAQVTARVLGEGAWEGTNERLPFELQVAMAEAPNPLLAQMLLTTEGTYSLKENRLTLDNITLKADDALKAEGDFEIGFTDASLKGKVEANGTLEGLTPGWKGQVEAQAVLEGTLEAPKLKIEAQAKELSHEARALPNMESVLTLQQEGQSWGGVLEVQEAANKENRRLQAHYGLQDNVLTIRDITAHYDSCNAEGKGRILLESWLVQGDVEGRCADLKPLALFVPEITGGSARFSVQLEPGQENAQRAEAKVVLSDLRSEWGDAGQVESSVQLADAWSGLPESVDVILKNGVTEAFSITRGTLSLKPESAKAWNAVLSLSGATPEKYLVDASGVVKLGEAQQGELKVSKFAGNYGAHRFSTSKPLHAVWQQGALRADAPALTLNGGVISANGVLGADKQLTGKASWSRIKLAPFVQRKDGSAAQGLSSGEMGGSLEAAGTLAAPLLNLKGELRNVRISKNAPLTTVPLMLDYKDQTLHAAFQARQTSSKSGGAQAKVDVRLPLNLRFSPFAAEFIQSGAIAGDVNVRLSLDMLNALVLGPAHRLEGEAVAVVALAGTWQDPSLKGRVAVSDSSYRYFPLGVDLRHITAEARAEGRRLTITSVKAEDAKRHVLKGKGWIEWKSGDVIFEADASTKDMALIHHPQAEGLISGDVTLKGDTEGAVLKGKIIPRPLEIRLPQRFVQDVPELNVVSDTAKKGKEDEVADFYPIALDMTVDAEEQVFVRGWGLDAEIGGTLQVQGFAHAPEVQGVLKAKRGFYEEFGKRFALKDSTVTFEGDMPPSPYLNIVATIQQGDTEIKPVISGPLLEPKLTVESEPALPQEEALSRLLFGKDARSISAVQAVQLTTTLRRLSGKDSGFDPIGSARRLLGVDTLNVNSGEEEDSSNTTVGVGKYIRQNVYLEVEGGSGEGAGKAKVEVELTPSISVESTTGGTGQNSVGVMWKRDY